LNETGRKLAFRDKRHRLHLHDLVTEQSSTILNYATLATPFLWLAGLN
jgi:hypothetical protein